MTWRQRCDFASLSAWLTASVFMAVTALVFFGQDFRGYYAAARVLLQGGDIYNFPTVAAMMQATTGAVGSNPFYYPPWFALAMIPFAWLPYFVARALWMVTNVLAWVVGLLALSRALDWPAGRPHEASWGQRWLLYLGATYLFAWVTWRYEQLGILLFMLLALSLWALRTQRFWWSGVFLALLLTKPTISALVVIALLVWLARNRRWPALAGFAVTAIVLGLISLPFLPGLFNHLRDPAFGSGLTYVLDASGGIRATRINTTLKDWLTGFHLIGSAQSGIAVFSAVAGLGLLAVVTWRAQSAVTVAAAAVVVGFWLVPYALQYDFPPLVVTLVFGLRELANRPGSLRWLGTALLLGILSVPFWERPISDGFWIVIGLTLMLGLLALSDVFDPNHRRLPSHETDTRTGAHAGR
jgi:hypothetical protein